MLWYTRQIVTHVIVSRLSPETAGSYVIVNAAVIACVNTAYILPSR